MINFSDILGQAPAALIPMEHELLELLKKFLAFQFEIPNDKIWVSISADDDEPVAGIKEGAVIGRFNGRLMLPPEISLQKMDRKIWLEQLQKFAEDIKSEIMIADNDDKVFKVFKFTIFVPSIELPPEFEGPKKEEPKKEPPKPYEEGKEETEED